MIKLEKMSYKQPELDLIAEWRNQSMISLRSSDLTAKGEAQKKWVESFSPSEKYYYIYDCSIKPYATIGEPEYKHNFVGYCGLDKINSVNRTAEIGLLIRPDSHKQGYGSAAVKELLKLAFNQFNLNCVFAEVIDSTTNWAFWSKQGFHLEGSLKQRYFKNGKYYNSTIGSILKSFWETLNG